jgi:class 3 adenylate cyclase
LYLDINEIDSSFTVFNKVIEYNNNTDINNQIIRVDAFISQAFLAKNDLANAIRYAEKSYNFQSQKQDKLIDDFAMVRATKTLSEAYAQKNDYKKAYYFLDKYNTVKNRYTEGNSTQKITNMLRMFDFEKRMDQEKAQQLKEKEITQQKIEKERVIKNSFIIGFILLLLVLILLYNQYNLKRRSNESLHEKNQIISQEKERSEKLLLNILPSEVAEELKSNGFIESKVIEQVTVLFTDFKGFTSLTEKLTPKELVDDLHECFSAFDHISEKYGIEKIKTIGDAFMAVGGLPSENDTHAMDAVNAALEMAAFVNAGKEKKQALNRPYFEVRIGLHTGPVVAGIVGLKKFQYDIWGDTVNIASRMESHGEVGKINISQKTYELVKDNPTLKFESRGKIKVKGDREIDMYFLSLV